MGIPQNDRSFRRAVAFSFGLFTADLAGIVIKQDAGTIVIGNNKIAYHLRKEGIKVIRWNWTEAKNKVRPTCPATTELHKGGLFNCHGKVAVIDKRTKST